MPLRVLVQPFITDKTPTTQGIDVIVTVWNEGREFALLQEMSCSWTQAYRFDREGIQLEGMACSMNLLQTSRLEPGQKVVHARTALFLFKPLPQQLVFRVGLVQPDMELSSQEIERLYRPRGGHRHLPEESLERRNRRKRLTFWSAPVRVRARTRWHNSYVDDLPKKHG